MATTKTTTDEPSSSSESDSDLFGSHHQTTANQKKAIKHVPPPIPPGVIQMPRVQTNETNILDKLERMPRAQKHQRVPTHERHNSSVSMDKYAYRYQQKTSVALISYRICVVILLLYAVLGVTYLLITQAQNEGKCECNGQNLKDAEEEDILPVFVSSFAPTTEPTLEPSMQPSASPVVAMSSESIIPQNSIVIWSECSNVPNGWKLCDGTQGTPDLRGKFVIGADDETFIFGQSGGNKKHSHAISTSATVLGHALSVSQMPPHNHNNGAWQYLLRITGSWTGNNHDGGNEPDIVQLKESFILFSIWVR